MLYLGEQDIKKIGVNWNETIDIIKRTVECLNHKDFSQPVKPYLRYGNQENRIIAMPAFLGGEFDIAGIKWIASFPKNIKKSMPRAHSILILNETRTGRPLCIINTALLSVIRTVSVSGLMIKFFDKARHLEKMNFGIVGWGPIGQYHYKMMCDLYSKRVKKISIFDILPVNKKLTKNKINTAIVKNWQEAYRDSDIFAACTASKNRYIDEEPKKGALILNISLRDFKENIFEYVRDTIIVDDWNEVCRENTDIELMSKKKGLKEKHVKNMVDVVNKKYLEKISKDKPIMFNPMGMAVFDIAIAKYYFDKAKKNKIGQQL